MSDDTFIEEEDVNFFLDLPYFVCIDGEEFFGVAERLIGDLVDFFEGMGKFALVYVSRGNCCGDIVIVFLDFHLDVLVSV